MRRLLLVTPLLAAFVLGGCDDDQGDAPQSAVEGSAAVAVDDAEEGTLMEFGFPDVGAPDLLPSPFRVPPRRDPALPRLRLRVAPDGCTVVRTEPRRQRSLRNVSWTVYDRDGEVLFGVPAASRRRFDYDRPDAVTVQLRGVEAGVEKPASNVVRVRC